MCGHLSALRMVALERLLAVEALLALHAGTPEPTEPTEPMPAALAPSSVASDYVRFPYGAERPLQLRPGWWARFQRADGFLPGAARLALAGGIVLAVLCVGSLSGESRLAIYNGLGLPVEVKLDGATFTLQPYSSLVRDVAPQRRHHIVSRNEQGQLLEEFDTEEVGSFSGAVYNVGGAAVLVESTASYGSAAQVPPRILGAPRWSSTNADILFSRPPDKVSGNSSNTRSVLAGLGELEPEQQLALLTDAAERTRVIGWHARWDDTLQPHTADWLELAARDTAHAGILAQRLKASPRDVVLLRIQQDLAGPERSAAVCAPYQASAAREPDNGDLQYIALRCSQASPELSRQFLAASRTWPDNPWLAYVAAYTRLDSGDLVAAIPELQLVVKKLPPKAEEAAVLLARLQRYTGQSIDLAALREVSPRLNTMLMLERSPEDAKMMRLTGMDAGEAWQADSESPLPGYSLMARGDLDAADKRTLGHDWQSAHLLRMLAGSDGASSDVIRRALALPQDQGSDPGTHLVSLALAMKTGADTAPYMDTGKVMLGIYQPKVMAFLEQLRRGANPATAEASLSAVPLAVRMYVYSAGIILLGDKAPPAWRIASRRMLFASERPYFHS
ncbi:hypothetical protein ACL9RI_14215 [Janthinobacterium sp. Mn2066]|uniref:hypothetical protein n=1 Tax=Janthinobacterium sp. Mn2066 TaxID=3395264 RepID=UPI003BC3C7CC